jgi:hypothetical protein
VLKSALQEGSLRKLKINQKVPNLLLQETKLINRSTTICGSVRRGISRNIYTYADIHKRRLTIKAAFETVKDEESVNFTAKIRSFRHLLPTMGFRWKET